MPVLPVVKCAVALLLLSMMGAAHAYSPSGLKADLVLVKKSERKLVLLRDGQIFREFKVALGSRPAGHKQYRGDDRTPEGRYWLDYKRSESNFYKAIHISYPNASDLSRARALGVDPGGSIMIHGFPNNNREPPELAQRYNWTSGCIAVTNAEMDEIWASVEPGTPIEIAP
jgi:murein L,D-transpeptidase YafK